MMIKVAPKVAQTGPELKGRQVPAGVAFTIKHSPAIYLRTHSGYIIVSLGGDGKSADLSGDVYNGAQYPMNSIVGTLYDVTMTLTEQ